MVFPNTKSENGRAEESIGKSTAINKAIITLKYVHKGLSYE